MDLILKRISHSFRKKTREGAEKRRLYFLLYETVKEAILNADLPVESNLPPSRKLSDELQLSRSTVLKAYELLSLEDYITSKVGSAYVVKPVNAGSTEERQTFDPNINYPPLSLASRSFLDNVGMLNTTDDKSIAFRPGLPPLDIFPVNQWKNLSNLYWRHIKSSALTYSPSSGNEQLKKSIANYLNLSRGIKCDSSQVIIVSGSLQSLYMLGNVIMNPGDTILVENPTFPNVKSIFRSLRSQMIGIGVDRNGIKVEEMDGKQQRKAKLIHTTPSNHYPTGVRMSMERRRELLAWAQQHNAFIVENDYEHEVNNYESSLPALFTLDKQQRTIFLGTFNRLLHPSIRIGYMVVPPYLLEAVEALLKHSHRFVAPSIQVVLNQFIERKYIYSHIKNVVEIARKRRKIFTETFRELLGDRFPLQEQTVESLHLFSSFKGKLRDEEICALFARYNILVHAFSKCFVSEPKEDGLIFGYSSVRSPVVKRKVQQLAGIIEDHKII